MRSVSGLAMLCVLTVWVAVATAATGWWSGPGAVSASLAMTFSGGGGESHRHAAGGVLKEKGSAHKTSRHNVLHGSRLAAGAKETRRSPSSHVRQVRPIDVYAATISGKLDPRVARLPERVYVPNSGDGTLDVIDPRSFRVVDRYDVGFIPHHVAPAWDMTKLYVDNEGSSTLTAIDPRTGRPSETIPVPFPYNLYFSPDGRKAVVVVERLSRLDFRDSRTFALIKSVEIPWPGVDHLDFSADGRYLLASTEWSGMVVKVDTVSMQVSGWLHVGGLPVDVRLAPDGSVFYVANQGSGGVSIVDGASMKEIGFVPTGTGAHGLYISRDTRSLYVTNRLAGTISIIDLRTRRVAGTWRVGGSPDMLQLSPDGRQVWVSDRYGGTVQVIDAATGKVLHVIPVGANPHGLSFFPNAGRVSLGHNGVYR